MRERFHPSARRLAARIARILVAVCGLALVAAQKPPSPAASNAIDTKSEIALLVDSASGAVLFAKNADKFFAPSTLTQLMTVEVVSREIKAGRLSLDGEFTVSEHAWRTGGAPARTTTMFAPVNSKAKISDLLRGVMIQSANDGAIALAEGIAGSESAFAELMNKRAAELGMTATRFGNPTGLPGVDNRTTAHDLVLLTRSLVAGDPEIYKIYSEREFTYNKIRQLNRNPLLEAALGGDGLRTAYSKDSGHSLVGSAVQGTQRLIVVIAGSPSEKERNEDAKKLLDWGFRTFQTVRLYGAGETIGEAVVFGGSARSVAVASPQDVDILVPRGNRDKLRARIVYTGPVAAPIERGRPIGRLWVTNDEKPVVDYPVVAVGEVSRGTLGQRAIDGTRELLIGLLRR